jgi:hypothetical protein
MTTVKISFTLQNDDGTIKTVENEPIALPAGAIGLCFGTVPMMPDGPAVLGLDGKPVYNDMVLDC